MSYIYDALAWIGTSIIDGLSDICKFLVNLVWDTFATLYNLFVKFFNLIVEASKSLAKDSLDFLTREIPNFPLDYAELSGILAKANMFLPVTEAIAIGGTLFSFYMAAMTYRFILKLVRG